MSNVIRAGKENRPEKQQRIIAVKPLYETAEVKVEPETSHAALVEQARQTAKQLIEQANQQKSALLEEAAVWQEQWETEKKHVQQQAFEQAFQQGFAEGKAAGYDELQPLIQEAVQTVHASKAQYELNVERAEKTILDIALLCAEKILKKELETDDSAFGQIVSAAVREVKNHKEVHIYVHPSKYSLVVSQKTELEAIFQTDANIYIFPIEQATEETCLIETAGGKIDASLDVQLMQLRHTLMELLETSL